MSKHDKDADQIADRIANGHGYDKHIDRFSQADEHGPALPVTNREQYRDHIAGTLKDGNTKGFQAADGRDQLYNAETNTFVGSNPKAKDHGTAFKPNDGPDYYETLKKDDADYRARNGLPEQPSVESGGYAALQDRKAAASAGEGSTSSASSQMDAHWPPPPPPPPPSEGETQAAERSRGRSR